MSLRSVLLVCLIVVVGMAVVEMVRQWDQDRVEARCRQLGQPWHMVDGHCVLDDEP